MRDPSVLTVGGIAVLKGQNPNRGSGVQKRTFLPGSLSPPSLLVLSREHRVQDLGAYSIVLWGVVGQLCTQPWEKTKVDTDGNPQVMTGGTTEVGTGYVPFPGPAWGIQPEDGKSDIKVERERWLWSGGSGFKSLFSHLTTAE